jgi:hypothetical protein
MMMMMTTTIVAGMEAGAEGMVVVIRTLITMIMVMH